MPPSVFIAVQCKQMLLFLKLYVQICQGIYIAAVISTAVNADIYHHVYILESIISMPLAVCVLTHSQMSALTCTCTQIQTHAYELNGNRNPVLTGVLN